MSQLKSKGVFERKAQGQVTKSEDQSTRPKHTVKTQGRGIRPVTGKRRK